MTRRPNNFLQRFVMDSYDHVSVTADTTIKLWQASRAFRLERVRYVNVTGLAVDATNFFTVKLNNGATIAASWSTETTVGDGAIPADAFIDLTLSATAADLLFAADDVLSLVLDEDGAATLPAGRIQIEGRYL